MGIYFKAQSWWGGGFPAAPWSRGRGSPRAQRPGGAAASPERGDTELQSRLHCVKKYISILPLAAILFMQADLEADTSAFSQEIAFRLGAMV